MSRSIYPTLVIGIGGTGCGIARSLFELGAEHGYEASGQLAIIGLDTDVHDIQRNAARVGREALVHISTADRVLEIIRRNPDVEGSWFYSRNQLTHDILSMSLDEGAGQMRILTRLALTDALRRGRIGEDIRRKLARLSEVSNTEGYEWRGAVHCYVIGSLAGATGCGAFLQIALIARQVAKQSGVSKISIRGLFLLPDLFIKAVGLPKDQETNVLVNGGAALRELNAIMQITNGRLKGKDLTYEYLPGHDLEPGGNPFDTMTFIDYETVEGQNLGPDIAYYKELAERIAFLQLFSPIGQEISQRTVNSIQQRLAAAAVGTTNSYSAVGLFRIRYPMPEILQHLTNRYAVSLLDTDWLSIDRLYRSQLAQYEERRRMRDQSVRAPELSETFVQEVDRRAKDRALPFADLRANVFRTKTHEDGSTSQEETFRTYVDALEGHAVEAFWHSSKQLTEAREGRPMSTTRFDDRQTLAETVRTAEATLEGYWNAISEAVLVQPDAIYESIQAASSAAGEDARRAAHHIQTYILAPPRHLLEVRYFLYLVRRELLARQKAVDPESLRRDIVEMTAGNRRVEKRAEGRRGRAANQAYAEEVMAEGFLTRQFNSRFAKFTQEYTRYYNTITNEMRLFAEEALKRRLYERLLADVEILITLIEMLFGDLEKLHEALTRWIEQDLIAHERERGAQRGIRYVFAGSDAKRRLWEQLSPGLSDNALGSEANARLVGALIVEQQRRRQPGASKAAKDFSIRTLFRDVVVDGYCRNRLETEQQAAYVMDVIGAIRQEAELEGRDWRQYLTDTVIAAGRQAKPFINLVDQNAGSRLIYWAVSQRTKDALQDDEFFSRLFRFEDEERALVEDDFDPLELQCVNLQYDFSLQNLSKLQPEAIRTESFHDQRAGRYDKAYRDRIKALRGWKAQNPDQFAPFLTPHLDVRWDRLGILPEIFEQIAEGELDQLYRGFAAALAMDYLKMESVDGGTVIAFYDPTRLQEGHNRQMVCTGRNWARAFEVFVERPELGFGAERGFDDVLASAEQQDDRPFAEQELTRKLQRPENVAGLFDLARNRNDPGADDRTARVLSAFFGLYAELVRRLKSDISARAQADLFREKSELLIDAAEDLVSSDQRLPPDVLELSVSSARNLVRAKAERWAS